MLTTTHTSSITFAVDDVEPATESIEDSRIHETLQWKFGPLESCSDYHGTVIHEAWFHPLLAAVHTAFSQHYPLVLTPDSVWLTIAQGVAQHMAIHGERLRSRFVSHQGKLDLTFDSEGWVEGSPENPWADAFASWAGQIRDYVGAAVHDTLVCDFSTTTPVERAASHLAMLDVFERFFHYRAGGLCGIPTITLQGPTTDWQRLVDKVAALAVFDIDWWLSHLQPICDHFVRASRGDVDTHHWQSICKIREQYRGDIINGWIVKLFPYLRSFTNGPCTRRNWAFETGEGLKPQEAPSGYSSVPFTWRNGETRRERQMEAIAGLVGVTQTPGTLALRPVAGWAVRVAPKLNVMLSRLRTDHTTYPGAQTEEYCLWPEDLCTFYYHTDGARLFDRGGDAAIHIVPAASIRPLDWGEKPRLKDSTPSQLDRTWFRFADLPDGTWLAVNLKLNWRWQILSGYHSDVKARVKTVGHREFAPIYHSSDQTVGHAGRNPVIALTFTEFLERFLTTGPTPYWLAPGFVGYDDAELYTRRD